MIKSLKVFLRQITVFLTMSKLKILHVDHKKNKQTKIKFSESFFLSSFINMNFLIKNSFI